MDKNKKISVSLFLLRLGVFVVMFVWTLDKFIRPEHAINVFKHFYFLDSLSPTVLLGIAIVEILILIGFLIGFRKKLTYGTGLVFHGISTFSSYKQYLSPFDKGNLLFFAAWPMLAACITLYLLRDLDDLYVISR